MSTIALRAVYVIHVQVNKHDIMVLKIQFAKSSKLII